MKETSDNEPFYRKLFKALPRIPLGRISGAMGQCGSEEMPPGVPPKGAGWGMAKRKPRGWTQREGIELGVVWYSGPSQAACPIFGVSFLRGRCCAMFDCFAFDFGVRLYLWILHSVRGCVRVSLCLYN